MITRLDVEWAKDPAATLRTEWTNDGARHLVDLDLADAPLPAAARAALADDAKARGPYWVAAHARGEGRGARISAMSAASSCPTAERRHDP